MYVGVLTRKLGNHDPVVSATCAVEITEGMIGSHSTEMLYSLAEKIVTDSFQTQVNRFTTHFCEYATAVWTVSIMQSELTIAEQRPGTFEIIPTIRT